MSFEKFLSNPIPIEVAAEFYTGLVKRAEWTELPDMSGELEGKFAVPVEQVLFQLKSVIAMKFRLMVAYVTYAESITDHAWRAFKLEFHDHAEDEKSGAEYYLKRATFLGGPILMDDIQAPPATNNPQTVLETLARGEQEAIAAQRILRQMVGEENPMKIGIEEQLVKDQHHLDEVFQMMQPEARLQLEQAGAEPAQPMEGGSPPELAEPVPDTAPAGAEPPADAKTASARLLQALEKKAFTPVHAIAGAYFGHQKGKAAGQPGGGAASGAIGATTGGALGLIMGAGLGALLGEPGAALGATLGSVGGGLWGYNKATERFNQPEGKKKTASADDGSTRLSNGSTVEDMARHFADRLRAAARGEKTAAAPQLGDEKQARTALAYANRFTSGEEKAKLEKAVSEKYPSLSKQASSALAGLLKAADDAGAQMAPPSTQQTEPTNYLRAELIARRAQELNESNYYREQLSQNKQQGLLGQQQVTDLQTQLQQTQEQQGAVQQQLQNYQMQLQQAQSEASRNALEAANVRMQAHQMRSQILEAASVDPDQFGVAPPMVDPMAPGLDGSQPAPEAPAPAGAAATTGQPVPPSTTAPPAGPPPSTQQTSQTTPPAAPPEQPAPKTAGLGGTLLGAGLGGLVGAGSSLALSQQQGQVGPQPTAGARGSFLDALNAAKQRAAGNPGTAALLGGATGAVGGALLGPSIAAQGSKLLQNIQALRG